MMLAEDQYKYPTGKMRLKQTAFRSSFRKSRSFGGVGFAAKLQEAIDNATPGINETNSILNESIEVLGLKTDAKLATKEGYFIVGEHVVISNHADILRTLVAWLMKNAPYVVRDAVDGIANMVKDGARFRKERTQSEPAATPEQELGLEPPQKPQSKSGI